MEAARVPRSGPYSDTAIVCALLDAGPSTAQELRAIVNRSEGAVHYSIQRLLELRLVEFVGYAPRKPGVNHLPPRLIGIGPRVRRWASSNPARAGKGED
jgi:hypothetical protein